MDYLLADVRGSSMIYSQRIKLNNNNAQYMSKCQKINSLKMSEVKAAHTSSVVILNLVQFFCNTFFTRKQIEMRKFVERRRATKKWTLNLPDFFPPVSKKNLRRLLAPTNNEQTDGQWRAKQVKHQICKNRKTTRQPTQATLTEPRFIRGGPQGETDKNVGRTLDG